MAKRNALRDVDPVAITICKQGANRQRIFLRKEATTGDLIELPSTHRLLKAGKDWTVFYNVVAEPGAEEDPGMVGEADSVDVWESEDEIRKAAHRLLKNKAYVNLMHDALEEEGCHLVENAVALADFTVEDEEGVSQEIKKGSWYVAIEPNDDARQKIEDGEFGGVSLEGTGLRVAIEKAGKGSADRVSASSRKKLSGIIAKYRKAPHPFNACMRDNRTRFAKPEAVCGVLKKLAGRSHDKLKKAKGDGEWVDALVEAGVNDENVDDFAEWFQAQGENAPEPIAKSTASFAERIAASDLRDSLWRSWSALEQTIYDSLNDEDLTVGDRHDLIATSLAEFERYLLGKLEDATASADAVNRLAKEVGTVTRNDEEAEPMGLADDFAALKKSTESDLESIKGDVKKAAESADASTKAVEGLLGLTEKLVERLEGKPAGDSTEEKPADLKKVVEQIGKLADQMDTFDGELTGIAKSVRELGKGESSQEQEEDRLRKSTSDDPLAGLLA